ncbi:MAG: 5-formyltetrahydrofolate cyclo-ligase [Candidatus Bathyarchaeia archaeon]|jgi:5-formyltetrahydrofolate cyclo-ligase
MSWELLESYERKRMLRTQMLALRNSKPASELDQLSSKITARLLELPKVKEARTISTYLDIGSEVRTRGLVGWALENGKRLIVPVVDQANQRLIFSEFKAPEELERGAHGIPEPKSEFRRPVALEQADVILVPGVAWDQRGFRIGYGAGYYDRSINALRTHIATIGLAYDFQFISNVPRSRYDQRVDRIVTESRIIDTTPKAL